MSTASIVVCAILLCAARYFQQMHSDVAAEERVYFKVATVYLMLPLAMLLGNGTWYGRFVAAGLLLCGVGDACLELHEATDGNGEKLLFLAGLAAFLLGHVLFIVAFAANTITLRCGVATALAVYAGSMFLYLRPHLPAELVVPVFLYAVTIGTMAVVSLCRRPPPGPHAGWSRWCGAAGALIFVASDSILSINMFALPVRGAKWWIMTTYYSGVFLITLSCRGGGAQKRVPSTAE